MSGSRGMGDGRGRGRGRMRPGLRPVSEEQRIDIAEQLEEFQRGDDQGERFGDAAATPRSAAAEPSPADMAAPHTACTQSSRSRPACPTTTARSSTARPGSMGSPQSRPGECAHRGSSTAVHPGATLPGRTGVASQPAAHGRRSRPRRRPWASPAARALPPRPRSKGDGRAVSVYKPKRSKSGETYDLPLCPATRAALDRHFQVGPFTCPAGLPSLAWPGLAFLSPARRPAPPRPAGQSLF
jgi:hypothetical protein